MKLLAVARVVDNLPAHAHADARRDGGELPDDREPVLAPFDGDLHDAEARRRALERDAPDLPLDDDLSVRPRLHCEWTLPQSPSVFAGAPLHREGARARLLRDRLLRTARVDCRPVRGRPHLPRADRRPRSPRPPPHGRARRAHLPPGARHVAIAGETIFHFFSITIPAFKIAGGILLFGVGLEMMRAKQSDTRATSEEQVEAESKEDVGIIPLGLPLLSGPGAIATAMVLAGKAKDAAERTGAYLAIVGVSALAFVMLAAAELVARVLGKTGINVIGRIMGDPRRDGGGVRPRRRVRRD